MSSVGWIARKFEVGQTDALNQNLIGADGCGRLEILSACIGDVIILVDAIATHAQASDQHSILVERQAAGEEHNPILIGIARLRALRARAGQVRQKQAEEGTRARAVDAGREQWLRGKTNRAVRDCSTAWHARQVGGTC